MTHQGRTAKPIVTDTGTIFQDRKVCENCHQPIEKTAPKPARKQAWVHSDSKSARCYQ